jgi:hypothetical protein
MVQLDRGWTEEELAFLGHCELTAEEDLVAGDAEDTGHDLPAGYRERLALGDLSW